MKRIIKIIGIIVFLVLAAMVILPYVFKGKLVQFAKDEINKNVKAKVDFSSANLSLFRSFPDFNLALKELQIVGIEKFADDTLLKMNVFSIDVDLFSVFRGTPYEIKKIELDNPVLKLITLKDGSVNYDITLPSDQENLNAKSDSISPPFKLNMQAMLINNGRVVYDDQELSFSMMANHIYGSLNGDFTADLAEIQMKLNSDDLNVTYEGFDYLAKVETEFSSLVLADMKTSTYTLKNTEAVLNHLIVGFEGSFVLGEEDYTMDFSFKSKDSNFKSFLSLLPVVYARQFDQLKAEGAFSLIGNVKGIYNEKTMPGFNINLNVDKASIRYPDLPKSIENISIALKINNVSGILDQTTIDLDRFKMSIAGNPLEAYLHLKSPVSDPDFDASLSGKFDLTSLKDVIPIESDESMSGNLEFDLRLKAKMSDIESKHYKQIFANGTLNVTELRFISNKYALPIKINKTAIVFSPATVDLTQFDLVAGKSDFKGSGRIDDFLPYFLSNEILKGKLSSTSDLIDVNDLLSGILKDTVSKSKTDITKLSLVLPERINLDFSQEAKKLIFEKYELTNVVASIKYEDQVLNFKPLQADMNGGSMKMEGMFDGSNVSSHPFDFDFNIMDFDFFQSYKTIGLFQRALPIAEKTKGNFTAGIQLKGKMDNDLNLVYESLLGKGTLKTSKITVESVKAMEQLADLLGNEKYRRLVTEGLNLSFELVNGKIYQKPFKLKYADSDLTIGGNIGFDQKIDFDLLFKIPYQTLGKNVQAGMAKLIATGANLGIPFDPGNSVQVRAKINGLLTDPKISLDYKDFLSETKGEIVAKVNAAIEKQKEELTQKLKSEAEKILNEAKMQGDALIVQAELAAAKFRAEAVTSAELAKNEANKQADLLVEEASKTGAIATLAAKEAAKKIRAEGDKIANKLLLEADNKANDLVLEAKKKADELMLKAQENANKI